MKRAWQGLLTGAAGWLLATPTALADWELNMPVGVTSLSREIYGLHMLIFGVCVVIAVLVFSAMIYSIATFRKSKGAKAASFSHNTQAEVAWTIVPILILVAMAVPAAKTLVKIEDTTKPDMSVKVTGYQWKWRYDYLDSGFGFYSSLDRRSNAIRQLDSGIDPATMPNYLRDVDEPMVVPVGQKVRVLLTSNDVLHAWWVPDIGLKKDAIPGYVNEIWFEIDEPGVYRGQCAELCGRDHGFMPIVVEALDEPAYAEWVAGRRLAAGIEDEGADAMAVAAMPAAGAGASGAAPDAVAAPIVAATLDKAALIERGEQTYTTHCVACHQANGQGLPPTFPALTGSPIIMGDIAAHIDIILNGRAGTAMAAFGGQLDDTEVAAVITYERNAWGNDTGDIVQPADIAGAR